MLKSLPIIPITLFLLFFASCSNTSKQVEQINKLDNERFETQLSQIKIAIDTVGWQNAYSFQGKGNYTLDSVSITGPYRISYVFQGGNNSSFTLNCEENGNYLPPLVVLTSSKSACAIKKDTLTNATLKVIANGRWSVVLQSLEYKSPILKDSLSSESLQRLYQIQDSLLQNRIAQLDSIQKSPLETQKSGLLEWQFLANSDYIFHGEPIFSLGNTKIRFVGELDIPEEKWYYDFMKRGNPGLLIELINLTTGKKTQVYRHQGKCGYRTFTKEISVTPGNYKIEYEGIGDIAFNTYVLQ